MEITIMDEDPGKDDMIGSGNIDLKDYFLKREYRNEDDIESVDLYNGNDSVGTFNFKILFQE